MELEFVLFHFSIILLTFWNFEFEIEFWFDFSKIFCIRVTPSISHINSDACLKQH